MESPHHKLSIIIPVYNIVRYLDRCLRSIVSQSFEDFELLLIDDGSTDDSGGFCDDWEKWDSRIRVFHKPNGGVSSARNLGLDNAKGEFITFVDGDDYILPGMYERLMMLQKEHDADIAIGGFASENQKGVFVPYYYCDEVKTLSQQEQLKCLFTNTYYSCSCCDKVFRRTLVQDLRFDVKVSHYEDLLFCYEAMKKSQKAVFTSEPFYRYCANGNGTTCRKPFGDKQMTMLDVWDYIREDAMQRFPELKSVINSQYYRNYIMCAMMAKHGNYHSKESWKRMKGVIGSKLLNILLCPSLALGYKFNALRVLMHLTNGGNNK